MQRVSLTASLAHRNEQRRHCREDLCLSAERGGCENSIGRVSESTAKNCTSSKSPIAFRPRRQLPPQLPPCPSTAEPAANQSPGRSASTTRTSSYSAPKAEESTASRAPQPDSSLDPISERLVGQRMRDVDLWLQFRRDLVHPVELVGLAGNRFSELRPRSTKGSRLVAAVDAVARSASTIPQATGELRFSSPRLGDGRHLAEHPADRGRRRTPYFRTHREDLYPAMCSAKRSVAVLHVSPT